MAVLLGEILHRLERLRSQRPSPDPFQITSNPSDTVCAPYPLERPEGIGTTAFRAAPTNSCLTDRPPSPFSDPAHVPPSVQTIQFPHCLARFRQDGAVEVSL